MTVNRIPCVFCGGTLDTSHAEDVRCFQCGTAPDWGTVPAPKKKPFSDGGYHPAVGEKRS
tara:strand:- start:20640 stop:20819 length:180 start_codon:yes stop_codon:yes gene_type:complete